MTKAASEYLVLEHEVLVLDFVVYFGLEEAHGVEGVAVSTNWPITILPFLW